MIFKKKAELNLRKEKVRLIPFKVQEVYKSANEIPEGVSLINAPTLWEKSKKGEGVVIAIIDTGCQRDHPELKDRIIGGRNFTTDFKGDPDNFEDNNGHGTHVAYLLATMVFKSKILDLVEVYYQYNRNRF